MTKMTLDSQKFMDDGDPNTTQMDRVPDMFRETFQNELKGPVQQK